MHRSAPGVAEPIAMELCAAKACSRPPSNATTPQVSPKPGKTTPYGGPHKSPKSSSTAPSPKLPAKTSPGASPSLREVSQAQSEGESAPQSPLPGDVCPFFLGDVCRAGITCDRRHPEQEEKEFLRRACAATTCRYGFNCRNQSCLYSHSGADEELEATVENDEKAFGSVRGRKGGTANTNSYEFPESDSGKGWKGDDGDLEETTGGKGNGKGWKGGKADWDPGFFHGGGKGWKGEKGDGKGWKGGKGDLAGPVLIPGEIVLDAAPPPPPQCIAGGWRDSLGNEIQVPLPTDGILTAFLSSTEGGRKELSIWLDQWGRLQCGNGILHQASYPCGWPVPPGMPPSRLFWRTRDWRTSTWERVGAPLAPPPPPPQHPGGHGKAKRGGKGYATGNDGGRSKGQGKGTGGKGADMVSKGGGTNGGKDGKGKGKEEKKGSTMRLADFIQVKPVKTKKKYVPKVATADDAAGVGAEKQEITDADE